MIVAVDNSFLCLLFKPDAKPPIDRNAGAELEQVKERMEAFLDKYAKDTVIVPAPCLAELLIGVPDVQKAIDAIKQYPFIKIADFNEKCAIELSIIIRKTMVRHNKKSGSQASWQKVKFDNQIATIAKLNKATIFYTDDGDQIKFAKMLGMKVMHSWDIKVPPK